MSSQSLPSPPLPSRPLRKRRLAKRVDKRTNRERVWLVARAVREAASGEGGGERRGWRQTARAVREAARAARVAASARGRQAARALRAAASGESGGKGGDAVSLVGHYNDSLFKNNVFCL